MRYSDKIRDRAGIKSIVAIYRLVEDREMESHGRQLCAFHLMMMSDITLLATIAYGCPLLRL